MPAVLYATTRINRIFLFWFAYVFTRPFGASFADWLGKDRRLGGLALGDGAVAGVLTVLIVAVVWFVASTGRDVRVERPVLATQE